MNKVFSFGVDEDSSFFSDEFSSVEEFFEKVGSKFSNVFLDVGEENSCFVVRDGVEDYDGGIDLDGMMESLDWDNGGKSEFKKLKKFVREVESEIEGGSVVVLSYYVGVDNSWLVMNKNDYDRLLVLCGENEEMI